MRAEPHDLDHGQNNMISNSSGKPVLEEPDGIRRTCPACQTTPPENAIRFFMHGTDTLQ
jgi:hypothetical protein